MTTLMEHGNVYFFQRIMEAKKATYVLPKGNLKPAFTPSFEFMCLSATCREEKRSKNRLCMR